jgi:hypothetical protein
VSSVPARLARALPALLAPGVVLAVDPGGWYPFGPLRWLVTTTLVLAAAALALATSGRPLTLPRSTWWACLALVAAMALSGAVGLEGLYAWTGTPEREAGVLLWVVCAVSLVLGSTFAGSRLLGPGLLAAGLALGATATAEALGWEPALFDVGMRLTGLMGSSAFLGAAASLLLPISVGLTVARGRPLVRLASATASITLLVALVGSGARAAWGISRPIPARYSPVLSASGARRS